jgi:glycosyltransferase involved in cell wall biosynthesis
MDKKVSIITPCYNGENYISRFIHSILNQTYKNIEFILINDGSTDKTEEVVMSYNSLFEERGIDFIYIYQENAGQAAALNKGLKIFKGDYLTWPDSDDMLTVDSIEKKVRFLEENKEFGIVRSDGIIVNENHLSKVIGTFAKGNSNKNKEDLFLDFVTENKVWFANGCYMARSNAFFDVKPCRTIYPTKAGQNWQMFLPIMYKYKCGFIDAPLYTYVIRDNSHSHSVKKLRDQLKQCDDHEDILLNTINNINMNQSEKQKYKKIIEEKYVRKRFSIAIHFKDKSIFEKEYQILSGKYDINIQDRLKYFLAKYNLYFVIQSFRKIDMLSKVLRRI